MKYLKTAPMFAHTISLATSSTPRLISHSSSYQWPLNSAAASVIDAHRATISIKNVAYLLFKMDIRNKYGTNSHSTNIEINFSFTLMCAVELKQIKSKKNEFKLP
eukprot:558061_1